MAGKSGRAEERRELVVDLAAGIESSAGAYSGDAAERIRQFAAEIQGMIRAVLELDHD